MAVQCQQPCTEKLECGYVDTSVFYLKSTYLVGYVVIVYSLVDHDRAQIALERGQYFKLIFNYFIIAQSAIVFRDKYLKCPFLTRGIMI